MTDDQINAAIAKACGWTDIIEHPEFGLMGINPETHGCRTGIEYYCADLNAMHEAEKIVVDGIAATYAEWLSKTTEAEWSDDKHFFCATARQRAEAFLQTLGLWEEAE